MQGMKDSLDPLDVLADEILQTPLASKKTVVSHPLTPQQQEIIRNSYIRLLGYDWDNREFNWRTANTDTEAICAINNSLVINPDKVADPSAADGIDAKALEEYGKRGFHASKFAPKIIHESLSIGGYAYMVEHRKYGRATPYGFQVGFPFMPPKSLAPTLAASSMAARFYKKHQREIFQIWRSGIPPTIDFVRSRYQELAIPINEEFVDPETGEDVELQRLGAGVATKYFDAIAADITGRISMQCNIGAIHHADGDRSIITKNRASTGSNEFIFDRGDTRTLTTPINKDLEIVWANYFVKPADAIRRALGPKSPMMRKHWPAERLEQGARDFAGVIHRFGRGDETEWMDWAKNCLILAGNGSSPTS
jgi:hypothetical protein